MEDWIHINPNSGQGNDAVEITIDVNTSSEDRQGSIDVRTSTLNKILNIIQKGADMEKFILGSTTHPCYPNGINSGNELINYVIVKGSTTNYINLHGVFHSSFLKQPTDKVIVDFSGTRLTPNIMHDIGSGYHGFSCDLNVGSSGTNLGSGTIKVQDSFGATTTICNFTVSNS